jgi:hypothetical protein
MVGSNEETNKQEGEKCVDRPPWQEERERGERRGGEEEVSFLV